MSENKPPHPGNLYAHVQAHRAELKSLYPAQFSGQMISCDWPAGWHPLVSSVCSFVAESCADVKWAQIKEKYGGLRMYYEGQNFRVDLTSHGRLHSFYLHNDDGTPIPDLQSLIDRTEALSLKTCALCGVRDGIGRHVETRMLGGWLTTICEECVPHNDAYRALPWEQR